MAKQPKHHGQKAEDTFDDGSYQTRKSVPRWELWWLPELDEDIEHCP